MNKREIRGPSGRVGAWVPRALIKAIDSQAAGAGMSRSAMVHRALDVMFKTPAVAKAMAPLRSTKGIRK